MHGEVWPFKGAVVLRTVHRGPFALRKSAPFAERKGHDFRNANSNPKDWVVRVVQPGKSLTYENQSVGRKNA